MTTRDNLMTTPRDNLNPAGKLENDNHDNLPAPFEATGRAYGNVCRWLSQVVMVVTALEIGRPPRDNLSDDLGVGSSL